MYCNYAEGVRLLGMLRSFEGGRHAIITKQDMITVAHWLGIYNIIDTELLIHSYDRDWVGRLEFHDLRLDQLWNVDYAEDGMVLDWLQVLDWNKA